MRFPRPLALLFLALSAPAFAQEPEFPTDRPIQDPDLDPTIQEILRRLDALEEVNAELLEKNLELEARNVELERRLDVVAGAMEDAEIGADGVPVSLLDRDIPGLGPAASAVYYADEGVSIGGYGEAVYSNFAGSTDSGLPSGKKDTADLLRAVLYFGYKFDDHWVFNSEIEFEHATTGKFGEASVEFAYIDYLAMDELNARAGLLLLPMGFLNEYHEPTTFFSALRPGVERVIIPSTWRENGAGLHGNLGPFTYRTYVVNGLDASGFTAAGLRGGRQKGSKAMAEDLAWVGRLDFTDVPGLLVGGSVYAGNSGQGLRTAFGSMVGAFTTIVEGHVEWNYEGLRARALGVYSTVDNVTALNVALGLTGAKSIGEILAGFYLEAGYDVFTLFEGYEDMALIPFVRWETLDTQKGVPAGFVRNPANDMDILTIGVDFMPIPQIIAKADYMFISNGAGSGVDQFNLALGWIF